MDNFNIATLSVKPRKWITTLHNNYCLTSVDKLLDSRNAATASKPNVALLTTVLKINDRNYSEYVLCTHSPLIISTSAGIQYLLCLY